MNRPLQLLFLLLYSGSSRTVLAQAGPIVDLVANADIIIVANATGQELRANGDSIVTFRIGRVFKGKVQAGGPLAGLFAPQHRAEREQMPLPKGQVMVFLKDYSGSAKPLMLKPDLTGPGVGAGMIALGDVPGNAMTPKAASVVDCVFLELAAAAQRRSTDERYLIYISMLLDVDHSPALRSTLKAWLGGRNRNLATLAAGLLFRTGDEEALERLGSELKARPRGELAVHCGSAFSAFRSETPETIARWVHWLWTWARVSLFVVRRRLDLRLCTVSTRFCSFINS
jgi:hypothetical protein